MFIELQKHKVKCDMGICKNNAFYTIGGEGVATRRHLNICEECAKELYFFIGTVLTPKSPENLIKKAREYQNKTL